MEHSYLAWILLVAPLAAAIAILLRWYRDPGMAMFASVGSSVICFVVAIVVAFFNLPEPEPWTWFFLPGSNESPAVNIEIGMVFDALSKGMLLVVTGVGMLVHIYSCGYMKNDPGRGRFFGGLSIFMFSMTGIVISTNLIEMFFFWEGVGLSSYLLIGFWFTKESAAAAANKAFVCNRLADFGFMIGILTYWLLAGTVSITPGALAVYQPVTSLPQIATTLTSIPHRAHALPQIGSTLSALEHQMHPGPPIEVRHEGGVPASAPLLFVMVFGLFMGCVGKSAMFPFHVWLPDAMEGPTPVSALIHAATMVAAGVYMLCRVYPLLVLSPAGMFVIASTGCFTAIFAAVIAVQQNDIKRILAYSTLSQLGYMVMAVGCGGPDAAMFHLTTHAFFKALLFLGAGSVIHALHDEQDIWKMGGLGKKIPLTFYTFGIGMLALSGLYPLAGCWSKDYILEVADAYGPIYYWVGVFTAFLTAFYMTRLVVVAFLGHARSQAAEHPHESPGVMTTPLIVLSVLSVVGGFIGIGTYYTGWFEGLLQMIGVKPAAALATGSMLPSWLAPLFSIPTLFVVAGLASAYFLYIGKDKDPLHIEFLARKFYIDEFYMRSLVGGQQLVAIVFNWVDSWILEGLIIRGAAYVSVGFGELFRLFQTGSLQTYALIFSLGGVLVVYFTLFAH
jgi:NADH-quinone oxidoreductase subunit L